MEQASPNKAETKSTGEKLLNYDTLSETEKPSVSDAGFISPDTVRRAISNPAALNQADVKSLQRTIGNKAVLRLLNSPKTQPSNSVIQRQLIVENIDYDPVGGQFRHGIINQANFFTSLKNLIPTDVANQPYRNQFNNVIEPLKVIAESHEDNVSLKGRDINHLAQLIMQSLTAEYGDKGVGAFGSATVQTRFTNYVITALTANINHDHNVAMTQAEGGAYDQLKNIVGVPQMSRAKGTPTPIAFNAVPAPIRESITRDFNEIIAENALWQVADLRKPEKRQFTFPDFIVQEVSTRQRGLHYQGNHSNMAEWLPTGHQVPVPSPLRQLQVNIQAAASPGLQAQLGLADPVAGLALGEGQNKIPNAHRQEYMQLLSHQLQNFTDAQLHRSIWHELTFGVSPYIEFSLSHDISRMVIDVVQGRVYLSAHYKWREGYNPWFEVTNVAGLPQF